MWECSMCFLVFATLRFLVSHVYVHHSQNIGFQIRCPVTECEQSYHKYNSFYRHVHRDHKSVLDVEITNQIHVDTGTTDACTDSHDLSTVTDTNVASIGEETSMVPSNNLEEAGPSSDVPIDEINNQEADNLEDLFSDSGYKEAIQKFVVTYSMNLKEMYKTREKTTEFIAEQTNIIVQQHVHHIQRKLVNILERRGLSNEGKRLVNEVFESTDLPFDGLVTLHERNKYIRNNFMIAEPEFIHLGNEPKLKRRHEQEVLDVVEVGFTYISMIESLKQFFQNEQIADLVFTDSIQRCTNDGYLTDFIDGSIFKTHPLLSTWHNALRICIYFDDLEICNPLGKRAGIHKIGVFYYSILNLPNIYRSRLPAIRILAVVKRKIMSDYGINSVLRRINQDLDELDNGVIMSVNGQEKNVRGAAIAFIGDTLAANEFCGFKIGVGFAFQKCRECECTDIDMQSKFHNRFFRQRKLHDYDRQCRELSNAQTKGLHRRISTAYGINVRSTSRDWPNFNLLEMAPEDAMHVIYEGVALYEVKAILKVLVENNIITLCRLNNLISYFPYGYKDRECKPSPIPEKIFNSDDTSLKQSASSMIVLIKLLPFMLIEKLDCDKENDYVCLLSEFCEIVKLMMASVISFETVEMLKIMVESHLTRFKELFTNKTIIPKQHYLIHLIDAILRYGPLNQVWSMRYEGKHQFIKQRMSGNPNFKNIVKSLCERCAMYEASLNLGDEHVLFANDLVMSKYKTVENLEESKKTISAFFKTDVNEISSVYSLNWIIYNGQKFSSKLCDICFGENEGLPEFGTLIDIWVSMENNKQQMYFVLKMFETISYHSNVQGYEIKKPDIAQGFELVKIQDIFLPMPLHAYSAHNTLFIFPPFDIMDLIHLKQQSYC